METLTAYRIELAWSETDEAFIATVPALPGCAADGPTPEDAIREVRIALDGHLAARKVHGIPMPVDPMLERLRSLSGLIKLSALARKSGIPESTLRSKIERGTPVTPGEALRLQITLETFGLRG